MPYTYSVGHTAGSLGLSDYDDPPATLREDGPGVYTARWDDKHSAILRFEDTGDDLRVIDAEGGDELAVIEGVGMGYIERWASDGPALDVDGLAIMDGDQFIGVDLPDSMDLAVDRALTVDDSGFLAITLGPDGLVHVHRSNDGRIWTETGVVGDDPAGPTDIRYVGADPGSITVWLEADPWMPSPAWTSTDGVTWERGEPEGGRIGWYRFASGWISEIGYPEYFGDSGLIGDRIWFQPRGGVAVAIDIGSLGIGEEPPGGDQADTDEEVGGSALLLSSNSIGYAQHQGERRDIWIITFDDLPA